MPGKPIPVDARIAELASKQHGAVTSRQLLAAGLSEPALRRRVAAGRLHPLHRGVYAVGHIAPSIERRWLAAVLAVSGSCHHEQGTAVLSHRSAAELWRLLTPSEGPVDVALRGRSGRLPRSGIRIHRPASLEPPEIGQVRGIPVTSPVRTLTDIRRSVSPGELRHAVREADVLGLPTGTNKLRDGTRSELEHRFLQLCRRHRLPAPEVNIRLGDLLVDFCWREQKIVVETDGYRYHRGHMAFEEDKARDLQLRTLGYQVIRLSHRQVFKESIRVAAALKTVLGAT